jgi:hypothetical protein
VANKVIELAHGVKHSTTPTRREAGIAADFVILPRQHPAASRPRVLTQHQEPFPASAMQPESRPTIETPSGGITCRVPGPGLFLFQDNVGGPRWMPGVMALLQPTANRTPTRLGADASVSDAVLGAPRSIDHAERLPHHCFFNAI